MFINAAVAVSDVANNDNEPGAEIGSASEASSYYHVLLIGNEYLNTNLWSLLAYIILLSTNLWSGCASLSIGFVATALDTIPPNTAAAAGAVVTDWFLS